MDGAQLKFTGRLRASTIMEMVVAMVIIVMVLGIALTIFSNVTRSSLSSRQLRARAVLEHAMLLVEHHPDSAQLDILAPGWQVQQQVEPYGGSEHLQQVHLVLLDENLDTLAQLRKLIIIPSGSSTTSNTPAP